MFLTVKELIELTGLTRPSAQIRWLRLNGLDVLVRADGRPIVSRAAVECKLGTSPRIAKPEEPDWGTLNVTSKTA